MDRFPDHYRLLGIRPGDSWHRLRSAYKTQMRRWHPDRFGRDESQRRAAEEKTKEINHAYQELSGYYHTHGRLPLDESIDVPPPTIQTSPSTPPATASAGAESSPGEPANPGFRQALIVSLVVGLIAGYLLWSPDALVPAPSKHDDRDGPVSGPARAPEADTKAQPDQRRFGVGATLGEVHALQGIPTRVDGDVWYYGDARVYFREGRVAHWVDTSDNRLKTQTETITPAPRSTMHFGRGSTKEEVRAIQGTPLRESHDFWDYGLSRVYFDTSGHVTGWQESPLNPLHVKR